MGEPTRWLGSKTETFFTMDTLEKGHVRDLHAMYNELKAPVDGKDPEAVQRRNELIKKLQGMVSMSMTNLKIQLRLILF